MRDLDAGFFRYTEAGRQIDQGFRQSGGHIHEYQVADALVVCAHTACEHLQHVDGDTRILVEPREQSVMFKPDNLSRVRNGDRRRRTRPAFRIEHRNLTQYFTRSMNAQKLHAAVAGTPGELHAPTLQQIHAVISVPFRENHAALAELRTLQVRQKPRRLLLGYLFEQRGAQQDVVRLGHRVGLGHDHGLLLAASLGIDATHTAPIVSRFPTKSAPFPGLMYGSHGSMLPAIDTAGGRPELLFGRHQYGTAQYHTQLCRYLRYL